ncbi:hypothetical protein ACFYZ4_11255 [Streptomyces sp. NPDC001513]|uniref:hypothetical protein n=1 Tax=Streptomyces sp. NPDC001513 TaxID=3364580 RepID=UPI003676FCE6
MNFQLTPISLVVAALLFHQVNRLWEYGFTGVGHHFAPAFGIRLPRRTAAAGQLIALPAALLITLTIPSPAGRVTAVLLLAFWVLATQVRLSDHCWLGAVAATVMAFTPSTVQALVAQDLLAGVYLTAALLKVNEEYLFTERSAGRVVTTHYLRLLGLPVSPRLLAAVPTLVILVEFLAGVLTCVHGLQQWALGLAILMHLVFGVSGNYPFSVVALALWVTAFSPTGHIELGGSFWIMGAASLFVGLLSVAMGRTARGRRSASWLIKDFYQGAVYGSLCVAAALAPASGPDRSVPWVPLVHSLVVLAFVVNFVLVVARIKLEWSFAMFTSLRPFGRSWLERQRLREWPRYYALTLPPRIPKSLLRDIDATFVYLATRDENVVHEGVAHHLEAVAQEHNVTFAPRLMTIDAEKRELVPSQSDHSPPLRRFLGHPALVPKSLDRRYLA